MRVVAQYLQAHFPFWNRTQGRDHIFWMTLDRGACHIEQQDIITPPIKLVHFAYTEKNPKEFTWWLSRAALVRLLVSGGAWPAVVQRLVEHVGCSALEFMPGAG
jgi:hypothetical protein